MNHGIFETIAVHHGHPIFPQSHLDRLEYAMAERNISADYNRNEVLHEIRCRAKGKDQIAVKVVLDGDGVNFYERPNPYGTMNYNKGFTLCISDHAVDETNPLLYCKSSPRNFFDTEKQNAAEKGFDEVIFTNQKGHITEGAVSNIFCIKKGKILTPAVTSGLLDGILRRFLISIHNGSIEETTLTKEDLFEAEEIFLTNSLMGIMPVCSLDGKRYLTGGKGTKLSNYYQYLLQTLKQELSDV